MRHARQRRANGLRAAETQSAARWARPLRVRAVAAFLPVVRVSRVCHVLS
jgi:hypothetical protein